MISVVIPTHDCEEGLARTLSSLVPAAAEGVVREVVVVDGGSDDDTLRVADATGCVVVARDGRWGERIAAGIEGMRRAPWLLILPPRVDLDASWHREASLFIERVDRTGRALTDGACLRIAFDSFGWRARVVETLVGWFGGLVGWPLADQGLLLSRPLWDRVAGKDVPATYAALVRRIGRRRLHVLRATVVVMETADAARPAVSMARLGRYILSGLGLPGTGFEG